MRKVLMIVRREYLELVRTKGFWIGMLIFPIFIGAMFAVQIALAFVSPEEQKTIAIIDATTVLVAPISISLAEYTLEDDRPEFLIEDIPVDGSVESSRAEQESRVLDGRLYGIVTIGPDIEDDENFRFFRKNVGDERTMDRVRNATRDAVIELRLQRSGLDIDKETLDSLTERIRFVSYQVSESGELKRKGFIESYMATMMFIMMMYFLLFFYGFQVARGVIQEKNSRVMEVLLGSVSPVQLMSGKILGIGLAGLTQTSFYVVSAMVLRTVVSVFFAAESGGGVFELAGFMDAIAPSKLIFFMIYFVLGYFLFVTFFAIIGSVCNTEQEAQNFQMPVVLMLVIPMISTIFFVQHPDSTPAIVLSLVPVFTPMLMFMRITVVSPPFWQIALSIVLLLGAIYVMFRVAAKIFRIGTLMYGKRPTVSEIWRWARS
jgi:ABC-2 type transport system permease protein